MKMKTMKQMIPTKNPAISKKKRLKTVTVKGKKKSVHLGQYVNDLSLYRAGKISFAHMNRTYGYKLRRTD